MNDWFARLRKPCSYTDAAAADWYTGGRCTSFRPAASTAFRRSLRLARFYQVTAYMRRLEVLGLVVATGRTDPGAKSAEYQITGAGQAELQERFGPSSTKPTEGRSQQQSTELRHDAVRIEDDRSQSPIRGRVHGSDV